MTKTLFNKKKMVYFVERTHVEETQEQRELELEKKYKRLGVKHNLLKAENKVLKKIKF